MSTERIGGTQPYRDFVIRRTHAGYAIEDIDGAHWQTVASYELAVQEIDCFWAANNMAVA